MNTFINYIKEKKRIHFKHIRGLICGYYPEFVYRKLNTVPNDEIPVFTFHSVKAKTFELQIRYLAENNYQSVDADELCAMITDRKKIGQKVVALTFDDGRGSFWAVAYPILKKYGFKSICFIIPGKLSDDNNCYPSLEDVWFGRHDYAEVEERDTLKPFCTWGEIQKMHASGIVDFQSHTTYHHSIFIDDKLIDVVNPQLKTSFLLGSLNPVVRRNDNDLVAEHIPLGQPIYSWAAAMSSKPRYIEDENLSAKLIDFVQNNGGESFFSKNKWRAEINGFMSSFRKENVMQGYWQTDEERYSGIYEDLLRSRLAVEERLNKRVKHLCYPWNIGSLMAVKASQEAGYLSNYWGIKNGRASNRLGDDPYYIKRLSANFIPTLPGKGRTSLARTYLNKDLKNRLRKLFF